MGVAVMQLHSGATPEGTLLHLVAHLYLRIRLEEILSIGHKLEICLLPTGIYDWIPGSRYVVQLDGANLLQLQVENDELEFELDGNNRKYCIIIKNWVVVADEEFILCINFTIEISCIVMVNYSHFSYPWYILAFTCNKLLWIVSSNRASFGSVACVLGS